MGLIGIIAVLMGSVGFLTFGFQNTVCGSPPNRFYPGEVDTNSVIINGQAFNLAKFNHPAALPTFDGNTNPLKTPGFQVAQQDISFMFQGVNGSCNGIIGSVAGSVIPATSDNPRWYFPCNPFPQQGSFNSNLTGYESSFQCHPTAKSRDALAKLTPSGLVAYKWDEVEYGRRNLAVFESCVFSLIDWYFIDILFQVRPRFGIT